MLLSCLGEGGTIMMSIGGRGYLFLDRVKDLGVLDLVEL